MKRRYARLLAGLTAVMMLAGCGAPEEQKNRGASAEGEGSGGSAGTADVSDTSAADEGSGEKGAGDGGWDYQEDTLTLLIDSDASQAGLLAVCDLAKEKLGITVEIETRVGGPDGRNIVKTRLASGDMSDLCIFNSGCLLGELSPGEYFIDLSDEPWADQLEDTFRDAASVDGKLYGIPFAASTAGLVLYNREIYEEYQLKVPATWDEFMENCEVLKENGETALIGSFGTMWTAQVPYLGDHYNVIAQEPDFAAGFQAGTAKYASTAAALRSFEKLEATVPYYNEDYMATGYDDGCEMLANGEGAHWIVLSGALANIYELYGEEVNKIGGFAIPGDDAADNGLTVWMPSGIYGNKNSEHADSIKRFMEFYISEEAIQAYSEALLPEGPYVMQGVELPENAYTAVKDMAAYYDSGKVTTAMEFQCQIKGANCGAICQECVSGQITGAQAAAKYDEDCKKQALQLGISWE